MTVAELIQLLGNYPQDHQVILAKDAEGNEFSPLSDLDTAEYEAESTWSGYIKYEDEDNEIVPNSVVLWPVN